MKHYSFIISILLVCNFISLPDLHAQWKEIKSLHGQPIRCFAATKNKIFAGADTNRVFCSSDGGSTWVKIFPGVGSWGSIVAIACIGDTVLLGSRNGVIYRSINKGESWSYGGIITRDLKTLAFNGAELYAGTETDILHSRDLGITWDTITTGYATHAFAFDLPTIIAGNFISIDKGKSWVAYGCEEVYSLFIIGSDVFAATAVGICISNNGGINWIRHNGGSNGLTDRLYFTSLVGNDTLLFVANSEAGVYLSKDRGNNWTNYNIDSNYYWTVNSLFMSNGKIFAGTPKGAWVRNIPDIPDTTVIIDGGASSMSIYPNPTSNIVSIHNAPKKIVSISVLNVLGQKLMQLSYSQPLQRVDISSLPTGVYYLRFESENAIEVRKIIKE